MKRSSAWAVVIMAIFGWQLLPQSSKRLGRDMNTSGDFFIISSVDLNKKEILLKLPTEITQLMQVNENTRYFGEQGKSVELKDLRAGDTVYIISKRLVAGSLAISVRKGPMTLEVLQQRYLSKRR